MNAVLPLLVTLLAQSAPSATPCMQRTELGPAQASVARFQYDKSGRLSRRVVLLEEKGDTSIKEATTFAYDSSGLLTSETSRDAYGFTTVRSYSFDASGRPVSIATFGAPQTEIAYDASGRKVRETAGVPSTAFIYDAAGKLTKSTRWNLGILVGSTTYEYDDKGRLLRSRDWKGDAAGEVTGSSAFQYGADGKLATETREAEGRTVTTTNAYVCTDPFPDVAQGAPRKFPGPCHAKTELSTVQAPIWMRFAYEGGRASSLTTYSANRKYRHRRLTFDAKGNEVFRVSNGAEWKSAFKYDADGTMSTDEGADGSFETVTTYEKDARGWVVSETVTKEHRTPKKFLFERDAAGRVVKKQQMDGPTYLYQYDEHGNLLAETPPPNIVEVSPGVTQYAYDCWLIPTYSSAKPDTDRFFFQDWHGEAIPASAKPSSDATPIPTPAYKRAPTPAPAPSP